MVSFLAMPCSSIGLAFAIGAPSKIKLKIAKKWWIVLWASLEGMYLSQLLLVDPQKALFPWVICNSLSTSATAMLWLYFHDKQHLKARKATIIFCSVFLLVLLSGLASFNENEPNFVQLPAQMLAWLFFILLAWVFRKQHMTTTLLLLAYANLQLPAGLIGQKGWGNDLALLLLNKLSLIGAMYYTLGIRDAKA